MSPLSFCCVRCLLVVHLLLVRKLLLKYLFRSAFGSQLHVRAVQGCICRFVFNSLSFKVVRRGFVAKEQKEDESEFIEKMQKAVHKTTDFPPQLLSVYQAKSVTKT